jgi:integrase
MAGHPRHQFPRIIGDGERHPQLVRALLDTAPGEWRAFVALCAFAGPRLGEAAALGVGDVDFLRRTLTVARQVQRGTGGNVEIRAPKYGSERTVYLADGLVTILAAHVAAHCPGDAPAGTCSASVRMCRRTRTQSPSGGAGPGRRPGAARSSCTT